MADQPDDALGEWTPAHTAKLAQEGNTEAARDILREFTEAVALTSEHNWPAQIPWPFVQYIGEAFRKITQEEADPARALGIKVSRAGRPAGSKTHDEVQLAATYWLLRRRGQRPEQANELIRSAVGADRTTVQKAADSCSALEDLDDDLLVAIAAENPNLQKIIRPG